MKRFKSDDFLSGLLHKPVLNTLPPVSDIPAKDDQEQASTSQGTEQTQWKKQAVKIILVIVALLCVFVLAGYLYTSFMEYKKIIDTRNVTVVSQLAYDKNEALGYTVYIEESGKLVPYLVLTDNYNESGNTLLLREEIMEERRCYNTRKYPMIHPFPYYNGSDIDNWLSNEYLETLSGVEPVASPIEISSVTAFNHSAEDVEVIERKAFLLSEGEVGGPGGAASPLCGRPLAYFYFPGYDSMLAAMERRTAIRGHGPYSWLIRTASISGIDTAYFIAFDGRFHLCEIDRPIGIRPALSVASSTPVELCELPEYGEVFVLKQ